MSVCPLVVPQASTLLGFFKIVSAETPDLKTIGDNGYLRKLFFACLDICSHKNYGLWALTVQLKCFSLIRLGFAGDTQQQSTLDSA